MILRQYANHRVLPFFYLLIQNHIVMNVEKRNKLESERHELSMCIAATEAEDNLSDDRKFNNIYNFELRIKIINMKLND